MGSFVDVVLCSKTESCFMGGRKGSPKPDTFFSFRTEKQLAGFESKDGKYKIHGTLVYSQEWLIFMGSLYVNIPSTNDKLVV